MLISHYEIAFRILKNVNVLLESSVYLMVLLITQQKRPTAIRANRVGHQS
jgi:hypothetical protein